MNFKKKQKRTKICRATKPLQLNNKKLNITIEKKSFFLTEINYFTNRSTTYN